MISTQMCAGVPACEDMYLYACTHTHASADVGIVSLNFSRVAAEGFPDQVFLRWATFLRPGLLQKHLFSFPLFSNPGF